MSTVDGPISVGWGWGAVSYAANNTIVGNNAHDYKTMLNDGGCIYTLSPQPGYVTRNTIVGGRLHCNSVFVWQSPSLSDAAACGAHRDVCDPGT